MSGSNGSAYAFCVACGCVTVHDGSLHGPHHWIERAADTDERRVLAGIVCNVCMPRPDLICGSCGSVGHDAGTGYRWRQRRPTTRELLRLKRQPCPACAAKKAAARAP